MMTIGAVIGELKKAETSFRVYFDFAQCVPTVVDSWRGIYAEPALGWEPGGRSGNVKEYPTVALLIAKLEAAIDGREFSGWKGGHYSYTSHDPLHIDNPGDYTNTELTRVEINDGWVILHTTREE